MTTEDFLSRICIDTLKDILYIGCKLSDSRQEKMEQNGIYENIQPVGDQQSLPTLIAEQLRLMILNKVLQPGEQLLSEPVLAKKLRVSRVTLREAIQILILEGLLIRKRGVGTFVASNLQIENPLNRNTSVTEFIQSKDAVPGTKEISISVIEASPYISRLLNISENEPVINIQRTRTANDNPVIYSKENLPLLKLKRKNEKLSIVDYLQDCLINGGSLYVLLKKDFDIQIDHAFARISAINADEFLADKLIISPGDCLIRMQQVDYDASDEPILLSNEYYPGQSVFTVYRSNQ